MKKQFKYILAFIAVSLLLVYLKNPFKSEEIIVEDPDHNINEGIDMENISIDSDSGVLLGLKSDCYFNTGCSNYRTLWIYKKDGKLGYEVLDDEIIVPYVNTFYSIKDNDFHFEKIKDDAEEGSVFSKDDIYQFKIDSNLIQSYPYGHDFKPSEYEQRDFFIDNNTSYTGIHEELVYAGNTYAIVKTTSFYSYSNDSINGSYQYNLYTIPQLNTKLNKGEKLTSLFKPNKTFDEYMKYYQDKYYEILKYDESHLPVVFNYADSNNLYLKRFSGKWNLVVPLSRNYNISQENKHSEEEQGCIYIDFEIPKSLSNYDDLMISPTLISDHIDGFRDAVSSPNKNLLVAFTGSEILVYSDPQAKLSNPEIKIPLRENESIISNQWSTGKFVQKWHDIILGKK